MDRTFSDIFTEPAHVDNDTLANLGPLRFMAGIWRGTKGIDVNPKADGPQTQAYIDHIELQPIDPQTNGPQLLYGLRYHQHIVRPGEIETYHDQIGYWLWEPATGVIIQTLAIPRGQIAMAAGRAAATARSFDIEAKRGETQWGICSNPFLDEAFQTQSWRVRITIDDESHWRYEQVTTLMIRGVEAPFLHTDSSALTKVGEPTPNPLMRGAG